MTDRPGGDAPRTTLDSVLGDAKAVAGRAAADLSAKAQDAKDGAMGLAGEARAQGEELLGSARGHVEGMAEQGKERGAEAVSSIAQAIHRVAGDLDDGAPELGKHVHRAAEAADGIAQALRDRSMGELVGDVSAFARRNPTAFFALSAVAGFALSRFIKSASPARPYVRGRAYAAPGWQEDDAGMPARPRTMSAASLGGAVAHRPGDARPGSMPVSNGMTPSMPAHGGGGQHGSALPNERSGTPL